MLDAKATLEFDLSQPEQARSHRLCVSVDKLIMTLWDIRNEVFRPMRKHGYSLNQFDRLSDPEAYEAVKKLQQYYNDDEAKADPAEVVGLVETLFYAVFKQHGTLDLLDE